MVIASRGFKNRFGSKGSHRGWVSVRCPGQVILWSLLLGDSACIETELGISFILLCPLKI